MPRRLALLVVLAAALAGPSAASASVPDVWAHWARPDAWIRSLDYVNPGQLVAGSEGSGVFSSTNAIGPWSDISGNLDTGDRFVHEAVASGQQVYLATSTGLFRGSSSGGSWTKLGVDPGTAPDKRLDQGGVQSVVFPTGSPSDILVAVAGSGRDGAFYSSDAGVSWTRAGGLTEAAYYMTGNAASPVLYAAADSGFYASVDKGHSWVLTSDGVPASEGAMRIAVSPDNPQHLYGATDGGVYRSDNGGASWYTANGVGQNELNGGIVRAFQLTPASFWVNGVPRFFVGTENGVWATDDGGQSWDNMATTEVPAGPVNMGQEVVWALNVGFGTPGSLIAGTQGHGIFSIPLQGTSTPSSIPSPDGEITQNSELTAKPGGWGGTAPFWYRYQWYRCTDKNDKSSASCKTIPGATAATYQLVGADGNMYMRVGIKATNIVDPGYSSEVLSDATALTKGPPPNLPTPPNVSYPKLVNGASAPWGQEISIDTGGNWHPANDNTPQPTTFTYHWYRCNQSNSSCVLIPDATGSKYTTTVDDITHDIEGAAVATIGKNSSDEKIAGWTGQVYERKPENTDAPRAVGPAYIGTTLQSTAGAWTGHNPTYTRRWLECNSDGVQCQPTSPVVTTSTYDVTEADRGSTLKVEVTATVKDPNQDRVTVVESDKSAVVGDAPVSPVVTVTPTVTATPTVKPIIKPIAPAVKLDKPKKLNPGKKLAGPKSVAGFTKIAYQWLRDGKPIKKATGRTYKIKSADRGKKLSLRLTLTGPAGTVTSVSKAVKIPKKKHHHRRRHHH